MQRVEEPGEPLCHIQRLLLGTFQNVVVGLAFPLDLRRQAVETLGAAICAGKKQIANGACDTAVAVVERVQGDEPQMGKPRLDQRRLVRCAVGPVKKASHLGFQPVGRRRFEMHPLAAERAGNHLHRTSGIVAPAAHVYPDEPCVAGGKQCCVPPEQAIPGERRIAVGGGVERHLDHALDVTVHRAQRTDVDAEAAGDGGAHRLGVELFALDLAGLDNVLGQRRQAGLVAQGHADIGQAAQQQTLGATDVGQRLG